MKMVKSYKTIDDYGDSALDYGDSALNSLFLFGNLRCQFSSAPDGFGDYGDGARNSRSRRPPFSIPISPLSAAPSGLICPVAEDTPCPSARHHNPLCYPTGKSRMCSV